MKRLNPSSERRGLRRFALVGALAVGLLAPAVATSGAASAASTSSSIGFAAAGAKTQLTGISVSGYDGKTVLASLSATQGTLALSTTTGLTLSYGYTAFSGASLNFTGSQDAVNTALKTLSLTLPATATGQITFRTMFTESKAGVAYFPENQHFYKFVTYAANETVKTASAAAAAASASKEFGLNGYLANITSTEENDFVSTRIEGASNVWIGGSDAESENTWKFTDGPDKGNTFWTGCANDRTTTPGAAPAGVFVKWSGTEPNNWGPGPNNNPNGEEQCAGGKTFDTSPDLGEDCLVTNWNAPWVDKKYHVGYWNDLPCAGSTRIQGYVIEYGNQVSSSSFPSGVDLRSQTLTILPAPKIPAKDNSFVSMIKKLITKVRPGTTMTVKTKATPKKPAQTFRCSRSLIRKKVKATIEIAAAGRYIVTFHDKSKKNKLLPMQCGSDASPRVTEPLQQINWRARGDLFERRKAQGKPFTRTVTVYVDTLFASNVTIQVQFARDTGNGSMLPFALVNNARVVRG